MALGCGTGVVDLFLLFSFVNSSAVSGVALFALVVDTPLVLRCGVIDLDLRDSGITLFVFLTTELISSASSLAATPSSF